MKKQDRKDAPAIRTIKSESSKKVKPPVALDDKAIGKVAGGFVMPRIGRRPPTTPFQPGPGNAGNAVDKNGKGGGGTGGNAGTAGNAFFRR